MLITNCILATLTGEHLGLVEDGALAVHGERIAWAGRANHLPGEYRDDGEALDLGGRLVTPGLIDCHTHLVFAGNRADEFEQRLGGADYAQIARAGGGIMSTVNAVRRADEDELVQQSLPRLAQMMDQGVTTLEIKSGYGLDRENEIKMLRAAGRLAEMTGVRVRRSFLAAHALPPEFAGRADDYIDAVCRDMLPAAHAEGVVDAVDVFIENIAFSTDQARRVYETAAGLGLPIKVHAEQLSHQGGTQLAAGLGALSADHLEYLPAEACPALAESGTVAVLLPGAFYYLGQSQRPPVQALREAGVRMAVASDCNPGSSPVCSPLVAMNMACVLFGLAPVEALRGMTVNAAFALGMARQVGRLEAGRLADLAIWNTPSYADLGYHIGMNLCAGSMINGRWVRPPGPPVSAEG